MHCTVEAFEPGGAELSLGEAGHDTWFALQRWLWSALDTTAAFGQSLRLGT